MIGGERGEARAVTETRQSIQRFFPQINVSSPKNSHTPTTGKLTLQAKYQRKWATDPVKDLFFLSPPGGPNPRVSGKQKHRLSYNKLH